MNKVVIKILQGSVLAQTVLDGNNYKISSSRYYFLQCICANNYESWLRVDKVIDTGLHSLLFRGHRDYDAVLTNRTLFTIKMVAM